MRSTRKKKKEKTSARKKERQDEDTERACDCIRARRADTGRAGAFSLHLLHLRQLRGEAAVHAEDFLVHDGRHGQAVEAIDERLPQLDVVPVHVIGIVRTKKRVRKEMVVGGTVRNI
jgi:hypothetical protein